MRDRHEQLLLPPSDAARRKARENIQQSSRNGPLAAAQNWRSLADGNIQFAVRCFVVPVRNSWLGITAIAAKTIENIAGRVSASDPSLVDIPEVSALRPVGGRNDGARTAVIMLAATRRLVDAMRQGAESLPNGAGLHMGKAQVGSLTTGESKNFTAIGDVVNTAARLQSAAGANEILVSEKVYGALSGEKPQADRTTLDLKGKAEATDRLYLALANCRNAANGVSGCTTPH